MQRRLLGWLTVIPLAAGLVCVVPDQQAMAKHRGSKHKDGCCSTGKGKTVASTVLSDKDLSTLAEDLKAAGLMCSLCGKGPFTLFAPSNEAYGKWVKGNQNYSKDKDMLKKVLKYHVVPQKLASADLGNIRSVKTAEGEALMINAKDGKVVVDGALVTTADIDCGNGVVHVIDTVLIPERGK